MRIAQRTDDPGSIVHFPVLFWQHRRLLSPSLYRNTSFSTHHGKHLLQSRTLKLNLLLPVPVRYVKRRQNDHRDQPYRTASLAALVSNSRRECRKFLKRVPLNCLCVPTRSVYGFARTRVFGRFRILTVYCTICMRRLPSRRNRIPHPTRTEPS